MGICSFCWPKPAAEFCLDFGTSWFIAVPLPFQRDTQTLPKMGNSTFVWEQGCITASEGPEPQQDPHCAALHCVLPPAARCRELGAPQFVLWLHWVNDFCFYISLGRGSSSLKKTFANPCLARRAAGGRQEESEPCWGNCHGTEEKNSPLCFRKVEESGNKGVSSNHGLLRF